jgi:predicted RNA-binding Zn-ribbon protein involved in translation (DUF1610 family)
MKCRTCRAELDTLNVFGGVYSCPECGSLIKVAQPKACRVELEQLFIRSWYDYADPQTPAPAHDKPFCKGRKWRGDFISLKLEFDKCYSAYIM